MKNNTLFIGATHGNEPIGVRALERLSKSRQDFDWIIGNPKAYELNERSFEGDLNRSAPGDMDSTQFASRRAAEIIEKSQNYKYTIDLHGSAKQVGVFIIITNLTRENIELAVMLDIDRIVYWPAVSPELNGPMSEFFPCGLEIECGPKDDPAVQSELENKIERFLDSHQDSCVVDLEAELAKREVFQVYGSLIDDVDVELNEFQDVTIGDETFCPLLVNSYKERNNVTCYKMQRVTNLLPL
ncbi:succinylglutamate desuccinylase/aspartoacylase family protein [Candidatus Uhrbacteria bacterium]|nr:succinylglutamate desuccinylase/aspartoacylase family protein [Candidatus Uhrbacteria bacterium]